MSIPAEDLVEWYARAKRELPWRAPGVSAVADPGQRVHAAADPGGAGGADLGGMGGALADAVGDGVRPVPPTCCGPGASSAIRGGRSDCTSAPS